MSDFSLSPFEMKMLMHYHCSPEAFDGGTATSELVRSCHVKLVAHELLCRGEEYQITERGRAWLDRALSTPLPVQKWVWE